MRLLHVLSGRPGRRTALVATAIGCIVLAGTIARQPPAHAAADGSAAIRVYAKKYARPDVIPFPSDNAHTPEREALGKTLFFDPRLSASDQISCATCHDPARSWGDGLPRAGGVTKTPR